jgi:16S rRNA (uracil1498-N3)-methyltransferase
MDCYYTPREHIGESELRITDSEFHHLAHVMRKIPGDELYVTAGDGVMYKTVLSETGRDSAVCRIVDAMPGFGEPDTEITLVQAVLKNPGKMDLIVEKATELGAVHIIPVFTQRTVAKGGKVERWRALTLAAMKQCCRSRLPHVDGIMKLEDAVTGLKAGMCIVCHEGEEEGHTIDRLLGSSVSNQSVVGYIGRC